MRWKGIIFLAILAGIVIALGFIFTDKWLEKRFEAAGTAIIGAKVEIDHLDFSLLGLHIRWDSLQATNPNNTMRNILTTGRTDFNMQLAPLFRKKVIIENIMMTNLSSGTERTTDGKVEKKKHKKSSEANVFTKTIDRLQKETASAPVWNVADLTKVNLDSLLAILKISSPQKIDSLRTNLTLTYDKWDSAFVQVSWEEDFTYLSSRINAIKPADIQTLEGLQTAYSTLEKVHVRVDSLGSFVSNTREHLESDLSAAANQASLVDDWINADYNNALAQAKLPSLDKASIARYFFGGNVVSQAIVVLNVVDKARRFSQKFKSDKPKKEKPPRLKGQTIYFSSNQRLPDLWIKNIELSGRTTTGLALAGQVQNIVSNQKIIGVPTKADIKGSRKDGAAVTLSGELNYLEQSPLEQFSVTMDKIPLNNVKFPDSKFLPDNLSGGHAAVKANFLADGDELNGTLDFVANELSMAFYSEASDPLQQTVRGIFERAKTIDVNSKLQSTSDRTQFSVNSNLDDLFSKEIEAIVGKELEKARTAIEDKVASEVGDVKATFDDFVAEKTVFFEAEMRRYENLLAEQVELVEGKKAHLEKRIEEDKKKAQKSVEDEAKKRLKGLFD